MALTKYVSLNRLSDFYNKLKTTFAAISHKHAVADLTDYTVDDALSATSTNPVQNRVLDAEFDAIANGMNALELAIDEKVDKEEGKGLSTNDFTNEEKEKLSELASTTKPLIMSLSATESENTTTVVNTFGDGTTETIDITFDSNGIPTDIIVDGVSIGSSLNISPIVWLLVSQLSRGRLPNDNFNFIQPEQVDNVLQIKQVYDAAPNGSTLKII